jgi:hypothetical protein
VGPPQLGGAVASTTQDVDGILGIPLAPPPTASGCVTDTVNAAVIAVESMDASVAIEGECQVVGLPGLGEVALAAAVPPSAQDLASVPNHRDESHRTGIEASVLEETLSEAPLNLRREEDGLIQEDSDPKPSTDLASQADLGRGQRKRKPTSRIAAMDSGDEKAPKKRR